LEKISENRRGGFFLTHTVDSPMAYAGCKAHIKHPTKIALL